VKRLTSYKSAGRLPKAPSSTKKDRKGSTKKIEALRSEFSSAHVEARGEDAGASSA